MTQSLCDPFSRTFRVVSLCELVVHRLTWRQKGLTMLKGPLTRGTIARAVLFAVAVEHTFVSSPTVLPSAV